MRALVVLHATDPASISLSVLARCRTASLVDVAAALHERRSLVRMMAMRRTLFVVPVETAPVVHAAASLGVAEQMRRRLLQQLRTNPTEPALSGDREAWLADVGQGAETSVRARGTATAAQIAADEPRLQTALLPTGEKKYDVRRNITSQVLVWLGAEGRIVRGEPQGGWTSRRHRWEPAERWRPAGLPAVPEPDARAELVRLWLARFGPGTVADLQWWTGWTLGQTRTALAALETESVDLARTPGLVLAGDREGGAEPEPAAALLPALDPTPMGWKERDFYLSAVDRRAIFDTNGNIGPTLWWDGEVVGGWATRPDGEVAWRLLVDRGAAATEAAAQAAAELQARLGGAVVVPSFRTPLERELAG